MKNSFLHSVLAAIVVLSSPIFAVESNNIQYNYAELEIIVDSEIDGTSIDGDGSAFGGSLRLDELFYIIADYEKLDYDANIDIDFFQLGIGVIIPYQKIDMVGELSILDANSDLGDYSDTGLRLSAGARAYIQPNIEVRGTLTHLYLDASDSYFTLAADYFISKSLSVGLSKEFSSDLDRLSIGLRYYVGE